MNTRFQKRRPSMQPPEMERPSPKFLAASVIKQADVRHPADTVLRDILRASHIPVSESRKVADYVFAFYRWKQWVDESGTLPEQLEAARTLAHQFKAGTLKLSSEELVTKAAPAWIWEEITPSHQWAETLLNEPPLWLRSKRNSVTQILATLPGCVQPTSQSMPEALVYEGEQDLYKTREFQDGLFEIQDISSQIVGVICDPQPGQTWWDACAGEGGKTLHLSDLMQNKGLIWASDRAEWRLKKLKLRTGRAGVFNYRAAPWDGSAKLPTKTKFDGILVDAPCSGVGTWGRNPHAKWTTSRQDALELGEVQKQLLRHCVGSLKPGGKLVYSVCTLTNTETVEVADAFEKEFPNYKPLELTSPLGGTKNFRLVLWPQNTGGNGMFIAAWQRS